MFSTYTWSEDAGRDTDKLRRITIEVSNKSRGMKWIYEPSCYAVPDPEEDVIFLSHWNLGNQSLKAGDQLSVSIFMTPFFQLKEWGMQFVHQQHHGKIQHQHNNDDEDDDDDCPVSFPHVIFGRLPDFELMPRTYFLSPGPLSRRKLAFNSWRDSFSDIVGESDQETVSTDKQAEDAYLLTELLRVDIISLIDPDLFYEFVIAVANEESCLGCALKIFSAGLERSVEIGRYRSLLRRHFARVVELCQRDLGGST